MVNLKGPYATADEALQAIYDNACNQMGFEKGTWPTHGNFPLGLAAALALLIKGESYEDFKDYPESLAERRSDKTSRSDDWSPRDALIATLRMIDRGEIKPDVMLVNWREQLEKGKVEVSSNVASPDITVTIGVFELCKLQMYEAADDGG